MRPTPSPPSPAPTACGSSAIPWSGTRKAPPAFERLDGQGKAFAEGLSRLHHHCRRPLSRPGGGLGRGQRGGDRGRRRPARLPLEPQPRRRSTICAALSTSPTPPRRRRRLFVNDYYLERLPKKRATYLQPGREPAERGRAAGGLGNPEPSDRRSRARRDHRGDRRAGQAGPADPRLGARHLAELRARGCSPRATTSSSARRGWPDEIGEAFARLKPAQRFSLHHLGPARRQLLAALAAGKPVAAMGRTAVLRRRRPSKADAREPGARVERLALCLARGIHVAEVLVRATVGGGGVARRILRPTELAGLDARASLQRAVNRALVGDLVEFRALLCVKRAVEARSRGGRCRAASGRPASRGGGRRGRARAASPCVSA